MGEGWRGTGGERWVSLGFRGKRELGENEELGKRDRTKGMTYI